ncbi:MAG: ferritin [Synergistaceae bacterium]|jgi:ferritin-like protein|nr:ferritin [Synergistaceae bacterium]
MQYLEEKLESKSADYARGLTSLQEELEAVNYYQQRYVTTANSELKEIVGHNRDEEIEHCCMLIEWLRRNMPGWDERLKTYLFTSAPLTEVEAGATGEGGGGSGAEGDLSIRAMR